MKKSLAALLCLSITSSWANYVVPEMISEVVYVESPTDTDSDGKLDRIYVSISRPNTNKKVSTIFRISPYATGGNQDAAMHNVDYDLLPQDEKLMKRFSPAVKRIFKELTFASTTEEGPQYASVKAHSVGTGKSTGCPTVGDMSETLAAKAVIDWLNGRARAFDERGREVKADWANGAVGMTGTSYDGTLPIMVATTGVEGLKAIIPVASISSWYDYYRANGLVVNPGGYIGEDADVLGYFIVRRGTCKKEMENITRTMGRESGDFTPFWQDRDYVKYAKNIKAATFIIHGQADWNVKQKHAIQLWEALEGVAPRRMFLHRGGHSSTWQHGVPAKVQDWFDHFLEGVDNGITKGPQVEVELPNGELIQQKEWPHEDTQEVRFYLGGNALTTEPSEIELATITDAGRSERLEDLVKEPSRKNENRLAFMTSPFEKSSLLSGTSRVTLNLAVMNRRAANITVVLVEYDKNGRGKIITRGWADPQNHRDLSQGELLEPGENYNLTFDLEPKQYRISKGSRLGVVVTSTDYEYTLRPKAGTKLRVTLGAESFIDLRLD